MCDLDRFKVVNDSYGHQAGDEAIKCLAALLKGACHPGDFVARYGGEEFVVLLADCDNATACRRAEQIRVALSQLPQPRMNGKSITVSFGVTEIQPGDTAETMLRRADRALLMAKENGRNQVVQLGSGMNGKPDERRRRRRGGRQQRAVRRRAADARHARAHEDRHRKASRFCVRSPGDDRQDRRQPDSTGARREWRHRLRRTTDRPVAFNVHLRFEEQRAPHEVANGEVSVGAVLRTRIFVSIVPRRLRDRRRGDAVARAEQVLVSLRSYLMAACEDQDSCPRKGALGKLQKSLMPWLAKKK